MEEINRLHDIADDIGSTSWGYELASALHNIAADIGEKVDEMRHVLAADGKPLEVGQTVWVAENGNRFHVVRLCDGGLVQGTLNGDLMKYLRPEQLTHKRPVLDADGVPIIEGEMVYDKDTGDRFEVDGFSYDCVICSDTDTCEFECSNDEFHIYYVCIPPDRLTHQRPVLDADGVEVHKGDEVWSTTGEFDGKRTVSSVHIDPDEPPYAMFEERQKPYSCLCCCITHKRPVLDADGTPIHEGDTVYNKVTGEPGAVIVVDNDGQQFATVKSHDRGNWCDPLCFTHTKPEPDSWGSVWMDVSNGRETPMGMERRCKALAERGE